MTAQLAAHRVLCYLSNSRSGIDGSEYNLSPLTDQEIWESILGEGRPDGTAERIMRHGYPCSWADLFQPGLPFMDANFEKRAIFCTILMSKMCSKLQCSASGCVLPLFSITKCAEHVAPLLRQDNCNSSSGGGNKTLHENDRREKNMKKLFTAYKVCRNYRPDESYIIISPDADTSELPSIDEIIAYLERGRNVVFFVNFYVRSATNFLLGRYFIHLGRLKRITLLENLFLTLLDEMNARTIDSPLWLVDLVWSGLYMASTNHNNWIYIITVWPNVNLQVKICLSRGAISNIRAYVTCLEGEDDTRTTAAHLRTAFHSLLEHNEDGSYWLTASTRGLYLQQFTAIPHPSIKLLSHRLLFDLLTRANMWRLGCIKKVHANLQKYVGMSKPDFIKTSRYIIGEALEYFSQSAIEGEHE